MIKKTMDIANFNLTYGNKEEPMLTHFTDLVYPAFKSEFIREKDDATYFFDEVQLKETKNGLALLGILVKGTKVGIFSRYDYKNKKIVEIRESHPSAPYSFFCIFLRNHRMIFVQNQKESPRLNSFGITARYVINQHRKKINSSLKEKIPAVSLQVVGIPSKQSISEKLEKVEKIKNLKLRVYPLNGEDLDIDDTMGALIKSIQDTRKITGSKTGNNVFNSPKNKEGVVAVVSALQGTADPTLDVSYLNGQEGKIKSENVAQKVSLNVNSEHIIDDKNTAIQAAQLNGFVTKISNTNKKIYDKSIEKIRKLME